MTATTPPLTLAAPFGPALAAEVAALLGRGGRVLAGWNAHWMLRKGERFVYERLKDQRQEVFSASTPADFAAWLALHSPQSLHALVRPFCSDAVELISHAVLAEAAATNAGVHDPTPYGADLARDVAQALDRGVTIAFRHRDYCGMGLGRDGDGYRYGPVFDGVLGGGIMFATHSDLIAWLAQQSDESLSGDDEPNPFDWDNQRITRARLLEAIAAIQNN